MVFGEITDARNVRSTKSSVSLPKPCHVPMVSSRKKQLTFARTADILSPERPNLQIQTIEGHEVEVLPSSWAAEDSEAVVEADSAEEVSVEEASEAVEPAAVFKVQPLSGILSIAKDLYTSTFMYSRSFASLWMTK